MNRRMTSYSLLNYSGVVYHSNCMNGFMNEHSKNGLSWKPLCPFAFPISLSHYFHLILKVNSKKLIFYLGILKKGKESLLYIDSVLSITMKFNVVWRARRITAARVGIASTWRTVSSFAAIWRTCLYSAQFSSVIFSISALIF